MARRGKTSPAEDLMDLVALLPWWAGVGLAVASYLVLHAVAAQPIVVSAQPGQIGATVSASIWKGLATAGQYIAPLICLGGAGLSAWRRSQRKRLVNDVAQTQGADALNGMRWQEFEMLVGESFRLQGFQVVETGGGGAWRRRPGAQQARTEWPREVPGAVQAVARLQGGCRCRA